MIATVDQPSLFEATGVESPPNRWQMLRAEEEAGAPLSDVSVLSFGAGQDSTFIFHKLWYDEGFRDRYAPGRLLIIHSDTGDEHGETYEHVERVKRISAQRGWDFTHITADMGYHPPHWQSLMGQFEINDNIMGVGFSRTCTDNLKIVPIYRYLADRLATEYDLPAVRDGNGKFQVARTMRAFVERYGRIRMILGIAAKEETRMYGPMGGYRQAMQVRQYPMAFEGVDRLDAIQAIESWGEVVPPPSHCMHCHYQTPMQLLLLYREHPAEYERWVEREAAKIAKNAAKCEARGVPNYGVYGLDLLPQVLYDAETEFGHMSTDELRAIAFTRGCSLAKY